MHRTVLAPDKSCAEKSGLAPCDKTRVLIADDEGCIVQLFEMILSEAIPCIHFDRAYNGEEAVRAFEPAHHAVLLLDLHMPVMDGGMAFQKIRQMCRAKGWKMPAVIFCTGFVPSDSIREVVARNPDHGLLSKPVSERDLVEAVRSRLG